MPVKSIKMNEIDWYYDNGDHIFFTSDLHAYHEKIIKLCNRPFSSVEEMNEKLIENWNSVVGKDDVVFNLGDCVFGGTTKWDNFLSRLNGHHVLIKGNHDEKNLRDSTALTYFSWVANQAKLTIEGRSVYLNHYPFLTYGGVHKDPEHQVWQLFGHVHSGPNSHSNDLSRMKVLLPTQYDVGVDNNNYTPVSWDQVKQIIESQVKTVNEKD